MPKVECMCKTIVTVSNFEFKPFHIDAKPLIDSYTKPWEAECSDLSFANLFIWGTEGKMEYAEKDNMLFIRLRFAGVPMFFWAPIPKFGVKVDYRKGVYEAIAYMRLMGVEPTFRSVAKPFYDMMQEACPELYILPTDVAWDYVYEKEQMKTLAGKKLHGKRNHINKFLSLYPEYEYRKLDASMIDDCMSLYEFWISEKEQPAIELMDEKKSVQLALDHMEALGLVGGAIYVENKLIAFTLGERLQKHMQLIHIEKADYRYDGIFPMINQQYVLHECDDVELINREEDMGIEGMRRAKRSYNPTKMIEKFVFSVKDLTGMDIWKEEME
ncbi:DUF2156 domain-containing protein [Chakrabartyella piscis]|uniref:DUF2156 domain-containing protein n=1 Tax=Chakrabartyella piscis TaxID=2918914 RepID=UPI002958B34E|nr:phosphatidylglycerol lysyltransferase domain-containing protein [Chakrabartyella piscis]